MMTFIQSQLFRCEGIKNILVLCTSPQQTDVHCAVLYQEVQSLGMTPIYIHLHLFSLMQQRSLKRNAYKCAKAAKASKISVQFSCQDTQQKKSARDNDMSWLCTNTLAEGQQHDTRCQHKHEQGVDGALSSQAWPQTCTGGRAMEPEPRIEDPPVRNRCTCCVACTAVVSLAANWYTSLHMLGLLKPFSPDRSS